MPRYCPNCGHEINPEWKVCPYCGYTLTGLSPQGEKNNADMIPSPQSSLPPPKNVFATPTQESGSLSPPRYSSSHKKHTGLIIGIVILLIVILAPVIYYAVLPQAEKATGTTITTGAIRVIYHSVLGNDIKIYIDDVYKGTYSSDEYHTFYGISPGTHVVTVKTLHDITLASKEVEVRAGETTTVELHFGS